MPSTNDRNGEEVYLPTANSEIIFSLAFLSIELEKETTLPQKASFSLSAAPDRGGPV